jgi:hypothetical protein
MALLLIALFACSTLKTSEEDVRLNTSWTLESIDWLLSLSAPSTTLVLSVVLAGPLAVNQVIRVGTLVYMAMECTPMKGLRWMLRRKENYTRNE